MRSLDDRQHLGAPAGFVKPCAEVDVLVVREERLVENRLAERVAAVERRSGGDAPRGCRVSGVGCRRITFYSDSRFATPDTRDLMDLPKRSITDVDAGAVDRGLVAAEDRLDRRELRIGIERSDYRRQPIAVENDVVVDERDEVAARVAIRGVVAARESEVGFAAENVQTVPEADALRDGNARSVVEHDYFARRERLRGDGVETGAEHVAAVDVENDDRDVTHGASSRGSRCRRCSGTSCGR